MPSLKLLLRAALIGGLILALLVPLALVGSVISDRKQYRQEAVARVAASSAGPQALTGPLRVIPWEARTLVSESNGNGQVQQVVRTTRGNLVQAPQVLRVGGDVRPRIRRIGLYEVPTFEWRADVAATFTAFPLPPVSGRTYGTPRIVVGIEDVRGLVGTPVLRTDGRTLPLLPGTAAFATRLRGLHADLPAATGDVLPAASVSLDALLAGTESLAITPVGDDTQVSLASTWPHPLFGGSFLPTASEIRNNGFEAQWRISSLASGAQQTVLALADGASADDGAAASVDLSSVSSGVDGEYGRSSSPGSLERLQVSLVDPVNAYSKAERATKYGVLFIVLTFVAFVLFELVKQWRISPLHYLLVGLSLALFFLLLLSLSEHMPFGVAYLVAAAACIALQGFYLSGVLGGRLRGIGFAAMLTALYGALYGLLASEDNALLMGSLLLFGVLAAVMTVTRHMARPVPEITLAQQIA